MLGVTAIPGPGVYISQPHAVINLTKENAEEAYQSIVKRGGASLQRDAMDERIIRDMLSGKGKIIDVQGGFPHGTAYEQSKGAWPVLKSTASLPDKDADGMPDEWERSNGLNPSDAGDASTLKLHPYFTNIEVYLNSLLK
jgi:hypothetical protein